LGHHIHTKGEIPPTQAFDAFVEGEQEHQPPCRNW
jgi:hypothetical protein